MSKKKKPATPGTIDAEIPLAVRLQEITLPNGSQMACLSIDSKSGTRNYAFERKQLSELGTAMKDYRLTAEKHGISKILSFLGR
jgi:hypothetical protein